MFGWDRCLGNISKGRKKRLTKYDILPFSPNELGSWLNIIKRSWRKLRGVSNSYLESFRFILIFVGLFKILLYGLKYFIYFVDEFLCYSYNCLLSDEPMLLTCLRSVNRSRIWLEKRTKIVRSYHGGGYYRKYDESPHLMGLFAKYL